MLVVLVTYTVDEKITQATTGAQGRVVEWDATNRIFIMFKKSMQIMD